MFFLSSKLKMFILIVCLSNVVKHDFIKIFSCAVKHKKMLKKKLGICFSKQWSVNPALPFLNAVNLVRRSGLVVDKHKVKIKSRQDAGELFQLCSLNRASLKPSSSARPWMRFELEHFFQGSVNLLLGQIKPHLYQVNTRWSPSTVKDETSAFDVCRCCWMTLF